MLDGGEEGKRLVQKLVDEIVQELKEEDYEEAVGIDTNDDDESTVIEPESSGMTIDDLIGGGVEDFDLDEVLEKISKSRFSLVNESIEFITGLELIKFLS